MEEAFGVKRLTAAEEQDPQSVPEAVFAQRPDYIPTLLENGRKIDELDDKGPKFWLDGGVSCCLKRMWYGDWERNR